jgi:hypothetical protein
MVGVILPGFPRFTVWLWVKLHNPNAQFNLSVQSSAIVERERIMFLGFALFSLFPLQSLEDLPIEHQRGHSTCTATFWSIETYLASRLAAVRGQ